MSHFFREPGRPAVTRSVELPAENLMEMILLRKATGGDRDAFGQVVVMYQGYVHVIVSDRLRRPEEAVEASQETFLRAWANLGSLRDLRQFKPWIRQIALNVTSETIRTRTRRREQGVDFGAGDAFHPVTRDPGPRDETLERALARLPEDDREMLRMRYQEDMGYESMARAIGVSEDAVRGRLYRALQALKEAFRKEGTS
ncbi:MAG: RNA polymerase sigma factor [Planctomycetota bacterium]